MGSALPAQSIVQYRGVQSQVFFHVSHYSSRGRPPFVCVTTHCPLQILVDYADIEAQTSIHANFPSTHEGIPGRLLRKRLAVRCTQPHRRLKLVSMASSGKELIMAIVFLFTINNTNSFCSVATHVRDRECLVRIEDHHEPSPAPPGALSSWLGSRRLPPVHSQLGRGRKVLQWPSQLQKYLKQTCGRFPRTLS